MAVFILKGALSIQSDNESVAAFIPQSFSVWTTFVVRLVCYASRIMGTGTKRIMRLDELSFVMRLERRITKG